MRLLRAFFPLLFVTAFLLPKDGAVLAHAPGETGAVSGKVELTERLGNFVPLDAVFLEESGREVTLKELVDRPTIVAPVYLSCTHTCPTLLMGLSEVLSKMEMTPGKDYKVITISFDEKDTPRVAAEKKGDYMKAVNKPFPEAAWSFLTGDAANISKFTEAAGFTFRKEKAGFSHPVSVIILSPDGKIVRYLYGSSFLPFDVAMALTEAAEGRVGSTARKVLLYCFSYNPLEKTYVFNILKVAGTVMVLSLLSFLAYLALPVWKKRGQR